MISTVPFTMLSRLLNIKEERCYNISANKKIQEENNYGNKTICTLGFNGELYDRRI